MNLTHSISAALKEAIVPYHGKDASPQICFRIKREFLRIMREKFRTDWSAHARGIKVEFMENGIPNITIPPRLLQRTLH